VRSYCFFFVFISIESANLCYFSGASCSPYLSTVLPLGYPMAMCRLSEDFCWSMSVTMPVNFCWSAAKAVAWGEFLYCWVSVGRTAVSAWSSQAVKC
jgi:hypothetical protein